MTVIVNRYHNVDTGEQVYRPGETIAGLSKKDELDLVQSGVCRYPDVSLSLHDIEAAGKKDAPPKARDEFPRDLVEGPKGTYTLPNGEQVKGKAKALEAYKLLVTPPAQTDDGQGGSAGAEDENSGSGEPDGGGPNTDITT